MEGAQIWSSLTDSLGYRLENAFSARADDLLALRVQLGNIHNQAAIFHCMLTCTVNRSLVPFLYLKWSQVFHFH